MRRDRATVIRAGGKVVNPVRKSCKMFPKSIVSQCQEATRSAPFAWIRKPASSFAALSPPCWASARAALLRLLLQQAGTPVAKDALIAAAWPGLAVEDSNLTVQVAALRRLFEERADGDGWIETLPRRGYRYVGPAVAQQAAGEASSQAAPALVLPDKPSIAVLPFSNLSGDPAQDYFADGMVDDIIIGLSRIKWLFVIARNSSFAYQQRPADPKQVGRELGVRYVLEGSVRKQMDRVRIAAQLVDAATGARHLGRALRPKGRRHLRPAG